MGVSATNYFSTAIARSSLCENHVGVSRLLRRRVRRHCQNRPNASTRDATGTKKPHAAFADTSSKCRVAPKKIAGQKFSAAHNPTSVRSCSNFGIETWPLQIKCSGHPSLSMSKSRIPPSRDTAICLPRPAGTWRSAKCTHRSRGNSGTAFAREICVDDIEISVESVIRADTPCRPGLAVRAQRAPASMACRRSAVPLF